MMYSPPVVEADTLNAAEAGSRDELLHWLPERIHGVGFWVGSIKLSFKIM